jgi:hypothetical protein
MMNAKQREQARARIRKFYALSRPVTDQEIDDEVAMVQRHLRRMTMDDSMEALYGTLSTGPHPIQFDETLIRG